MSSKKICVISDSPKVTSGFGNVAKQILAGFHDDGYDVYSLATMDTELDVNKVLPYWFYPITLSDVEGGFDELGYKALQFQLINIQPDVIFIIFDPGSAITFSTIVFKLQDSGNLKKCPIVLYTPIEGTPIPLNTAVLFAGILDRGGRVVLWDQSAIDLVVNQYPLFDGDLDFVTFGTDHADFRKYSDEKKNELRYFTGLQDYFIVGSIGTNKRTKGFDTIIYTARCLKDLNEHQGIKFYLHTSAENPTMLGYNLVDLANNYDVSDMIIYKPEKEKEPGGNIKGISRESIGELIKPVNDHDKKRNFSNLGFIDRLNLLDCYLDISQVEGWGLPAHEAMRCGVPTISVHDMSIRDSIYQGGVIWIQPLPYRTWTTWHTGVKLVLVDPADVANTIIELRKSSEFIKNVWSNKAISNSIKYTWDNSRIKMNNIIKEVLE